MFLVDELLARNPAAASSHLSFVLTLPCVSGTSADVYAGVLQIMGYQGYVYIYIYIHVYICSPKLSAGVKTYTPSSHIQLSMCSP